VAKEPIYVGWALAHPAGDVVPAANVEANGWHDLVELVDTDQPASPATVPGLDDEVDHTPTDTKAAPAGKK
jgi:hypothetical protein